MKTNILTQEILAVVQRNRGLCLAPSVWTSRRFSPLPHHPPYHLCRRLVIAFFWKCLANAELAPISNGNSATFWYLPLPSPAFLLPLPLSESRSKSPGKQGRVEQQFQCTHLRETLNSPPTYGSFPTLSVTWPHPH